MSNEEHEGIPSLRVELEGSRDVLPVIEGFFVTAALDDGPEVRGEPVDLEAQLVLEVPERLVIDAMEDPDAVERDVLVVVMASLFVLRGLDAAIPSAAEALAVAALVALAVATVTHGEERGGAEDL